MSATIVSLRTDFIDYLFGEVEGYLCVASTKALAPKDELDFKQEFFAWPTQREEIAQYIDKYANHRNLYFCTSLLSDRKRHKDYCLPGNIVWADLDFVTPEETQKTIQPSCVLETSPGKFQAFWRIDVETDADVLEDFAKKITYAVGADKGGWGLTKLMRIPNTTNFKYIDKPPITIYSLFETKVPRELFLELPQPGEGVEVQDKNNVATDKELSEPMPSILDLPDAQNIVYKYVHELNRQEGFATLYAGDPEDGADWSKLLWRLINLCIEATMEKHEVFAIALTSKCNKYKRDNRPDEYLWKEILKAWFNQKRVAVILDREIIELTMPELVSRDIEEDSFVKDYKEWGLAVTDAPPQYHELACFIALSSLISAGLRLETSWGDIRPHLWGLVLGESTLTRKTTAMRMAMDIVTTLDEELILAHEGSPEGILTQIGLRPKRVSILYRDEVAGLFESFSKRDYMAGLPEIFTLLYDVPKKLSRVLRKETITVSEPYFIFFGGGIRDKVYSLLTEEFVLSGFIPRFLIVSGENDLSRIRPIGPPTTGTDALKQRVVNSMGELKVNYNLTAQATIIGQQILVPVDVVAKLTPEAWEYNAEIEVKLRNAASQSHMSQMALPAFTRMSVSLLKMGMLVAASRREFIGSELIVEKRDLEQAAWYIQRWGKYTIELISQAGKPANERVVESIFQMIRREPGIRKSDIMRRKHLTTREAKEFLDTLTDRGLISPKPSGNGTRYTAVI